MTDIIIDVTVPIPLDVLRKVQQSPTSADTHRRWAADAKGVDAIHHLAIAAALDADITIRVSTDTPHGTVIRARNGHKFRYIGQNPVLPGKFSVTSMDGLHVGEGFYSDTWIEEERP